jgi:hypothetical protein
MVNAEQRQSYSPRYRTAVVFCGTGAHGAYHAGVLRALQEAGVKIDLVAGQGIGAATAILAAIDGGARLWDPDGLWRGHAARHFYGWKPLVQGVGWIAALLGLVLLLPLVALTLGMLVFAVGFLLTLLGITSAGATLTAFASSALQSGFASENLPTIVPRLAMAVVVLLIVVAAGGVLLSEWRAPVRRRATGGWWWRVIGAPLDTGQLRQAVAANVWQLIRGAAPPVPPVSAAIARRYAEVLGENLGQPGFRELLIVATDLDVRRDLVIALLGDDYRREYFAPRPGRDRRSEVLDISASGRDYTLDLLNGALTPPLACEPAYIAFAADNFWRGETHRVADRPAAVHRLLDEVSAAGAMQVVLVSGVASPSAPHALRAPRLDIRSRVSEFVAAAESASLRDAVEAARTRFASIHVICPAHNPIGPFDFAGAYDEASDRRQDLAELMERAYEDAYRQFIEPIVGASGDYLSHSHEERKDEVAPKVTKDTNVF